MDFVTFDIFGIFANLWQIFDIYIFKSKPLLLRFYLTNKKIQGKLYLTRGELILDFFSDLTDIVP